MPAQRAGSHPSIRWTFETASSRAGTVIAMTDINGRFPKFARCAESDEENRQENPGPRLQTAEAVLQLTTPVWTGAREINPCDGECGIACGVFSVPAFVVLCLSS
jgi:hypothetical protein